MERLVEVRRQKRFLSREEEMREEVREELKKIMEQKRRGVLNPTLDPSLVSKLEKEVPASEQSLERESARELLGETEEVLERPERELPLNTRMEVDDVGALKKYLLKNQNKVRE